MFHISFAPLQFSQIHFVECFTFQKNLLHLYTFKTRLYDRMPLLLI